MTSNWMMLKVDPVFERFLTRGGVGGPEVAMALQEVAKEALGGGGIFVQHFQAGQGTWPELDEDTARKKGGDGRKFYQTGGVWQAINREPAAGTTVLFGSSAEKPQGMAAIAYMVGGIYVRIYASGHGRVILKIGFAGDLRHSKAFNLIRSNMKKKQRLRWKASISRTEARMKDLNEKRQKLSGGKARGLRKWARGGTMGFKLTPGGKQKFIQLGEKDNLGYANIVQRGAFKGIRYEKTGITLDPQHLGRLRGAELLGRVAKLHGTKTTALHGVARPLLPFTDADNARIQRALERGIGMALEALRVQAEALGIRSGLFR